MSIKIKEVTTKQDLKKFVKFNLELYKDCLYHVPGLIADEMITLDKTKNPAFDFCEAIYFLAYKNDRIVGRIAGLINHRANEVWNQQYARFGFVDFINDDEVVDALFDAVEKWAKNKGMNGIQGPLGFTDLDHEGTLIEGFNKMGTMAAIYNYPYYPHQIERMGYEKDQDWNEFKIIVPKEIPEKYLRVAEIVKKKYGLKIMRFRKTKEIWPYAKKIFDLWNKAYSTLYAYSPLSDKQIEYYIKMYIPMLRLELVPIIVRESDDAVVGVGICMPNLSYALKSAGGNIFPFGFVPLLKSLYGKKVKVIDMMIIGVDPEYQNKGVNSLIFCDIIEVANKLGAEWCESNPELELNHKIQSLWDSFEATLHKKRRAYLKKI